MLLERASRALRKEEGRVIALILAVTILGGLIHVAIIPMWGMIDEAQHFDYVVHLLRERHPPILLKTYLTSEVVASSFEVEGWRINGWETPSSPDPRDWGAGGHSYEAQQPPLYYLFGAALLALLPVSTLSQAYAMRLFSLALAAASVYVAYLVAREIFPTRRFLLYGVPLFIALLPTHLEASAQINNDRLAEFAFSLIILASIRALKVQQQGLRKDAILGLLLGLGILTKLTVAVAASAILLVVLVRGWESKSITRVLKRLVVIFGIALLLAGWWYIRNIQLYGDFSATNKAINTLFPWLHSFPFPQPLLGEFFTRLFRGFWVNHEYFRWRNTIPLLGIWIIFSLSVIGLLWLNLPHSKIRAGVYWRSGLKEWVLLYLVFALMVWVGEDFLNSGWLVPGLIVAGVTTALAARYNRPREHLTSEQKWSLVLLLVSSLSVVSAGLIYSLRVIATEARVYFPAIAPISILLLLGLYELIPPRFHKLTLILIFGGFFFLDNINVARYLHMYIRLM